MRRRVLFLVLFALPASAVSACLSGDDTPATPTGLDAGGLIFPDGALPTFDAKGTKDAPATDAPADTTLVDTSLPDTSEPDTNVADTNAPDTNAPDTNVADTNAPDTNVPDSNLPDTNAPDTSVDDAGLVDVVVPIDAVVADAGAIPIASGYGNVTTVIADDTDFYFTTYSTTNGTVVRCPIAGGCAASSTVLAQGLNNPTALALDATTLYIGAAGSVGSGKADGFVYSCPRAGCGASDVDRVTLTPGVYNLGGITTAAGYVYFVQSTLSNTCGRVLADGGAFQWLGNATGYSSFGPTVDDANAYWTHTYYPPAIHVAPFAGDGGRVLVDIANVDGGLAPQGLTYDNGYLYYVSVLDNEVNRVQVDGGALQVLANGMHGPSWLALDATDVYTGDYYSPNAIRRTPKTGGPSTLVTNANLQLTAIALNSTSIFWSTATGTVWMLPK